MTSWRPFGLHFQSIGGAGRHLTATPSPYGCDQPMLLLDQSMVTETATDAGITSYAGQIHIEECRHEQMQWIALKQNHNLFAYG